VKGASPLTCSPEGMFVYEYHPPAHHETISNGAKYGVLPHRPRAMRVFAPLSLASPFILPRCARHGGRALPARRGSRWHGEGVMRRRWRRQCRSRTSRRLIAEVESCNAAPACCDGNAGGATGSSQSHHGSKPVLRARQRYMFISSEILVRHDEEIVPITGTAGQNIVSELGTQEGVQRPMWAQEI